MLTIQYNIMVVYCRLVVHTDAIMDQGCPPGRNTVNIYNPLTALLSWDKPSSDR